MQPKNRSRIEILYDIISSARMPVKKTHLMHRSNLSFKQLDLYLNFLLEQDLVRDRLDDESNGRVFFVSNKGMQFLSLFETMQTFLGMERYSRNTLAEMKVEQQPIAEEQMVTATTVAPIRRQEFVF
jgi:predicted transcriptional regulator